MNIFDEIHVVFFSITSVLSSSPSPSSSSCSLPPRCSHSFISLLLSCAVCLSSLLGFPYSVMKHNILGQCNNPICAVIVAHQVQWLLFILMDFIFQFWCKQLIDYCNCESLCVFQVHIFVLVMLQNVKLSAYLARMAFSVSPSTWNKTANFVQVAKHVSHFTVLLSYVFSKSNKVKALTWTQSVQVKSFPLRDISTQDILGLQSKRIEKIRRAAGSLQIQDTKHASSPNQVSFFFLFHPSVMLFLLATSAVRDRD